MKYKTEKYTLLLVNLKTAETLECDPDALRSRGYPEGYVNANDVTIEEWIDALKQALGESN